MSDPSTTRPLPPAQLETLDEAIERTRGAIECHEIALDEHWRILARLIHTGPENGLADVA